MENVSWQHKKWIILKQKFLGNFCNLGFQQNFKNWHYCDRTALSFLDRLVQVNFWLFEATNQETAFSNSSLFRPPKLRCHPEETSDQAVPDESNLWSDHPKSKCPLIRLKRARNTVRAWSALKVVSNQTWPDGNELLTDQNQTIAKKIVRLWLLSRLLSKHRLLSRQLCAQNYFWSHYFALQSHSWSDYCALEIASNRTQLRSQ